MLKESEFIAVMCIWGIYEVLSFFILKAIKEKTFPQKTLSDFPFFGKCTFLQRNKYKNMKL